MNDLDEGRQNILDEQIDGTNKSIFYRIRTYFFAGIFVTAPIGITVYLTWLFLRFVDDRVTALIPEKYNPFNYLPMVIPGTDVLKSLISLIVVIFSFVMIGWFAKNYLGRLVYQVAEYIVHRMPVINTLYKAIKQILETIMASQSQAFRDVVMLEYPRKGVWSLGFVTGKTKGEVQEATKNETISVFVPTTPNPTSGYLLFVPIKDVIYMNMSVEEAAKLIVSAGIITPPNPDSVEKIESKAKKQKPKKKSA